jgi:hypothetical protein
MPAPVVWAPDALSACARHHFREVTCQHDHPTGRRGGGRGGRRACPASSWPPTQPQPPWLELNRCTHTHASMHPWRALRLLSPQASEGAACLLPALTAEQADTQLIRGACDLHRAPHSSGPRPCCSADMEAMAAIRHPNPCHPPISPLNSSPCPAWQALKQRPTDSLGTPATHPQLQSCVHRRCAGSAFCSSASCSQLLPHLNLMRQAVGLHMPADRGAASSFLGCVAGPWWRCGVPPGPRVGRTATPHAATAWLPERL